MDEDELGARLDAVLVGGRRPAVVVLADPDPSWPQRFEEHRARIVGALGDVDVEHVGSTSVPGLAAKPIVDVQVAVADLDAAVAVLEQVGYVLRVREPGHRVVQAAPPLYAANVHLYLPGDPELDAMPRLRDRLRSDPDARRRYEDVKRSLSGREWPDLNYYAAAKSDIVRELLRG